MSSQLDAKLAARMDLRMRTLSTQMAGHEERKVFRRMFSLYATMPHLWNKKHKDFNSEKAAVDLRTLTKLYRQFDQHATVCTVRRKLEALTISYLLERKRIKYAQYMSPQDAYQQKSWLWHYKDFRFIDSAIKCSRLKPIQVSLRACLDETDRIISERAKRSSASNQPSNVFTSSTSTRYTPQISSTSKTFDNIPNVYLKRKINAVYEPHRVHQKIDAIAEFVESQLIGVDEKQREIAKRLISDTLIQAKIGNLTDESQVQLRSDHVGEDQTPNQKMKID